MYLTEEKRAEIRKCIEIQQRNSGENKISNIIKWKRLDGTYQIGPDN